MLSRKSRSAFLSAHFGRYPAKPGKTMLLISALSRNSYNCGICDYLSSQLAQGDFRHVRRPQPGVAPRHADTLQDALGKLDENMDEETASEILRRDLVSVYAKLNYAVNSAHLGPEALNVLTEDELIAWPSEMPFATMAELDEEVEESN